MIIRVFVSMPFKGKTEKDIYRYLDFAESYYRSNCCEHLLNEFDDVLTICNYWYENEDVDDKSINLKLDQYGHALLLMSTCDDFMLFTNEDGSMPFGCNLELQAWNNSGTKEQTHNAIILNSSIIGKGDKNE